MSFEAFVSERGSGLLRAAWLLTGDRHHAEDLLQTALVKCYSRYDGLDDAFQAYVRQTMYRTYVSWWRKRSWHEIPSAEATHEASVEAAAESRIDLARALRSLSRVQRAAITLRYFDDLPVAEVARALNIPEGTAKTHIHRGLAALRLRIPALEGE